MEAALAARWGRLCRARGAARAVRYRIERGEARDYRALAHHHYRGAGPASWSLVLRAVAPGGRVIGVLVVSMPTLHGSARRKAWPGEFESRCPRRAARALRRRLRVISRVIVDPRYRGLGVATALVRAYLADPLTERTEAVAALGPYCGFFAAAGMREVGIELHRRHARLRRALARERLTEADLLDPSRLRLSKRRRLGRELRAWARAARPPRPLARARADRLARAAGLALLARPRAYVAGGKVTR